MLRRLLLDPRDHPRQDGCLSHAERELFADDVRVTFATSPPLAARLGVDCRPAKRRGPRDAAKFEATGQARARVGWEYRLVGVAEKIVTANVRWLAGYRHPRYHQPGSADAPRRVFASPAPLMTGRRRRVTRSR
jgi:hypothetical protein